GALHDDQPPDDPPIYEAPPDYNEVIKVFIDPIESQRRRKRKRQLHHKNGSRRSQSTPRKALRNASPSGSDHIPSTQTFLEVPQMSTDTSDDYATISTCGLLEVERNIVHLQPYNNIMSRSCQTTPIPDSPPPPYVASLCPVSMDLGCFGRVRSEGDLTTHVSRDNTSLHQNYNRMSVVGQSAQQSWLLYNGRDSGNHCLSEIVCITGPQANHTQIPDYSYNEACSGLNINPTQESSSSSLDSDDNETKNLSFSQDLISNDVSQQSSKSTFPAYDYHALTLNRDQSFDRTGAELNQSKKLELDQHKSFIHSEYGPSCWIDQSILNHDNLRNNANNLSPENENYSSNSLSSQKSFVHGSSSSQSKYTSDRVQPSKFTKRTRMRERNSEGNIIGTFDCSILGHQQSFYPYSINKLCGKLSSPRVLCRCEGACGCATMQNLDERQRPSYPGRHVRSLSMGLLPTLQRSPLELNMSESQQA
ncbi:unnamed protein product, partial [Timema podura]|nr:unnamed protein product [Timema podura]